MTAQEIRSTVKVCMFDQYGTVVDMQGGLVEAATPYLRAKGWQGNPNSFVTWWRRTHFENSMIDALLHREHTPYREIGETAFVQPAAALDELGAEVADMRHRATERRAAEAEKDQQHFQGAGVACHDFPTAMETKE